MHIAVDFDQVTPNWGPWGEWGHCSVPCGGDGFRERFRECTGSDGDQTDVLYRLSLCTDKFADHQIREEEPCSKSLECVDGKSNLAKVTISDRL